MIYIKNISKFFLYSNNGRITEAIKDIDMEIEKGEFAVILGPSGCGKTTLLRLIAGLEYPSKGEIVANGELVTGPSSKRGMIFQSYTLLPWLTVENNILFGAKFSKKRTDEIKKN